MPEPRNDRATILRSIRHSLGEPLVPAAIDAEYAAIPRDYDQSKPTTTHDLIELFVDRLLEYDSGIYRVQSANISSKVAEILTSRGKQRLAIPAGLSSAWLPSGFNFAEADNFTAQQVDQMEGLISGCTVAIAETGSIVLQNASAQGPRILSLVPDYHLCIVFANQIVATVPEAFTKLAATTTLPTTFISGPSATADIEMTRIKGVHGPRFLDVILVID